MFRGGDQIGIGILCGAVCVIALSAVLGLLQALATNPWLWAFVIAAPVLFVMARRSKKNYGGPTYRGDGMQDRR